MPMNAKSVIWGLNSCRAHSNLEVAIIAMEQLLELFPDDAGNYVLLSNIYVKLGRWNGMSKMSKLMRIKSVKKTPGSSVIEVNNVAEEFTSRDRRNTYTEGIKADMVMWLKLCQSMQVIIYDKPREISAGKCKHYFYYGFFISHFLF